MKIVIPDLEISYTSAAVGACLGAIASIGNPETKPIRNIVGSCLLGLIFPFTVVNLHGLFIEALTATESHEIVRVGALSVILRPLKPS